MSSTERQYTVQRFTFAGLRFSSCFSAGLPVTLVISIFIIKFSANELAAVLICVQLRNFDELPDESSTADVRATIEATRTRMNACLFMANGNLDLKLIDD